MSVRQIASLNALRFVCMEATENKERQKTSGGRNVSDVEKIAATKAT